MNVMGIIFLLSHCVVGLASAEDEELIIAE